MSIEIQRIGGVLGVELLHFDVKRSRPQETWRKLRSLVAEHCLLLIRGEALTAPEFVGFAESLGPLMDHSVHSPKHIAPGAPKAQIISSRPDGFRYAGQAWHSDYSYIEDPADLTCFYMNRIPAVGGDTGFANMCAAYDALSERMKAMIEGLDAVHHNAHRRRLQYLADDAPLTKRALDALPPVKHPMVKRHPLTGRTPPFRCTWMSSPSITMTYVLPLSTGSTEKSW